MTSKRIQKNSISISTVEMIQEDVVDVPFPLFIGIVVGLLSSSTDRKLEPIQSRKPEIAHGRNSYKIGGRAVTAAYFNDTASQQITSRWSQGTITDMSKDGD
jgi:hypothetical protein